MTTLIIRFGNTSGTFTVNDTVPDYQYGIRGIEDGIVCYDFGSHFLGAFMFIEPNTADVRDGFWVNTDTLNRIARLAPITAAMYNTPLLDLLMP